MTTVLERPKTLDQRPNDRATTPRTASLDASDTSSVLVAKGPFRRGSHPQHPPGPARGEHIEDRPT